MYSMSYPALPLDALKVVIGFLSLEELMRLATTNSILLTLAEQRVEVLKLEV